MPKNPNGRRTRKAAPTLNADGIPSDVWLVVDMPDGGQYHVTLAAFPHVRHVKPAAPPPAAPVTPSPSVPVSARPEIRRTLRSDEWRRVARN